LGQVIADYGISAYFTSEQGIFVNLYVPSRFRWQQKGRAISLDQATEYPLDSMIEITVKAATPETFSIGLRIPAWAGKGTQIEVNSRALRQPVRPGTFREIRREWRNGDRLTLVLDRQVRLEQVDSKHRDLVALMHGPLALFATGHLSQPFRRNDLLAIRQAAPRSPEWRVTSPGGTATFKPYFAIDRELTRLYQPVVS
jgi:DUF1680 family protein